MATVIASHNQRILQPTSNSHGCNCRNRAKCPLDDKGLMVNIVYIKQWYQNPVNQITNILVFQKLHLKTASETTKETFVTKSMLTALNFLNICGN